MHIESKNQNIKRTMETKNILFFIFELQNPRILILWTRLILWLKMAATLASHVLVVIFVVALLISKTSQFFFGTYGFMVREKVEEVLFFVWNISKTICNLLYRIAQFDPWHSFAPRTLAFKLQQEVLKFNDICVSWSSQKNDKEKNFLNLENRRFWERQFFLIVLLSKCLTFLYLLIYLFL